MFGYNTPSSSTNRSGFGMVSNFVLFSGVGAVSNTGISTITGNVEQIWGNCRFVTPTTIDGTIENVNLIPHKQL
jgi:hypothetical protein